MILEKSCGALIYRLHSGRYEYLLIQQTDGHWGFPKGHVEADETETETALREVQEETGLAILLDPTFRTTTEYAPAPGHWKEVVYFLGVAQAHSDLQLQLEEVRQAQWYSEEEARLRLTYPSDREILQDASAHLQQIDRLSHDRL